MESLKDLVFEPIGLEEVNKGICEMEKKCYLGAQIKCHPCPAIL